MKLQRLNMDNSWSLEFSGVTMLIDPWLKGAEVDLFPWFNKQWHRAEPVAPANVGPFDLVLITQKYPDHFHAETLLELQPEHVLVPRSIERSVKKLLPKAEVRALNSSPKNVIGSDINIHFLPTRRRMDPIYDALLLENEVESILLATHGYTEMRDWTQYIKKMPPVKLAFTPFNRYQLPLLLGGVVAPGMDAVKGLIESIDPKYVIATHDEDKYAKGIVHKSARITLPPNAKDLRMNDLFKERLLTFEDYETHTLL